MNKIKGKQILRVSRCQQSCAKYRNTAEKKFTVKIYFMDFSRPTEFNSNTRIDNLLKFSLADGILIENKTARFTTSAAFESFRRF